MLVTKEIIRPGTYWYQDQQTGVPRRLSVTPQLTKYWFDQGNKMLSMGLTVPVPCEHDFSAHPMTPADKLKNNAGWVKEFRLQGDVLFGIVDIQDNDIAKKLPKTIRWSSPWISSFPDGNGRQWNNVISHLALTTRPRIVKQAPFQSITAAMSLAATSAYSFQHSGDLIIGDVLKDGFCLSRAGLLKEKDGKFLPEYPIAFSMLAGGILFADTPTQDKNTKDVPDVETGAGGSPALADGAGDLTIAAVAGQLLDVLNVQMPDDVSDDDFINALVPALIACIKQQGAKVPDQAQMANGNQPDTGRNDLPTNPLIGQVQQEQQPMYMSLEDINKIPDATMKAVALSMYNENAKLRAELDVNSKATASLRDAKLKEENTKRLSRVALLSKLSPRVKTDLEAMLALPAMALSLGEGGSVVDPLAQTLMVLEKGLADMPRLLTTDQSALSVQPQPTDGEMSAEEIDRTADSLARMMGCPPEKKAS